MELVGIETGNFKSEIEDEECLFDMTDKKWYANKKENYVIVCDSVNDLMNENGEKIPYSKLIVSFKKTYKKCGETIKEGMALCFADNGNLFLFDTKKLFK